MKSNVTVRYIGNEDFSRRYLLQRRDGKFYTGVGWTARMDAARLYDKLATAQKACNTILNRAYRAKPKRTFTLQLDLTVRGTQRFSADDLRRFLAQCLHINFDNAAGGDGPNGSFVQAIAALWSLREVYAEAECDSADVAD